jgi:LDH2 family malate/lactate/ureidoglycolate dehydrogenase
LEGVKHVNESVLFGSELLLDFCSSILVKAGLSAEDADIVADTLIFGDLRGVKSHGIVRLPTYVEKIEKGIVSLEGPLEYEKDFGAISLLNANNVFGQIAGYKAMKKAMDIARLYGIGLVGVKNSNHFGVTSYYSMMALENNMIGVSASNSSPAIAPFGTKTPLLGTNPLSIAIPGENEPPVVLDMSMSTVARGRIRYNAISGEPIPEGWGLDADGNPTTDPMEALKGSLVPIGGVKGSGLSLMIDLLCGVLTGNGLTGDVKNITDMSGPSKTGHMLIAINLEAFGDPDVFKSDVKKVIERIKSLEPLWDTIYMPGEIEHGLADKRTNQGIPVDQAVIKTLNELAGKYGTFML